MYKGYITKDINNNLICIKSNIIDNSNNDYITWCCRPWRLFDKLIEVADYVHQVYHDEIEFTI